MIKHSENGRVYFCDIQKKDIEMYFYRIFEDIKKGTIDRILNNVLHSYEAAEIVESKIQPLLPESRRTWRRKKMPASYTDPFDEDFTQLEALIVKSKKDYQYLYFPDDGSNSFNHKGNQRFMIRGANIAQDPILELITSKITKEITKE